MPVGCIRHIRIDDRGTERNLIDVYTGAAGGQHVVRTYSGEAAAGTFGADRLFSTSYFNAEGLLTRIDYTYGETMTLSPHECSRLSGQCRVTETWKQRGTRRFVSRKTRRGNKVYFSDLLVNEKIESDFDITLGPFNDITEERTPWARRTVLRYENCGT